MFFLVTFITADILQNVDELKVVLIIEFTLVPIQCITTSSRFRQAYK